ncbi:MAG TPA: biopolymer transporter ExbD [Candidatus Krumholzibacteria bacterium]
MKRPRGKFTLGPCEFQAASMADLGFLLLVFFIVTTAFAIEQGIPLVLPGRGRVIAKLKPSDVLEIRAHADGSVDAAGVRVPPNAVRRLVESRLARDPDVVVVLATDSDASYGDMIHILDQLKLAHCRRISLRSSE